LFFELLFTLAEQGVDFEVAILGQRFSRQPEIFIEGKEKLGTRVVQFGCTEDFAVYARRLWQADILPVTSHQDFFGISVMQALYCGCYPLLPNRLAYPELLPAESHDFYFYKNFNDLLNRTKTALQNIKQTRRHNLQTIAAAYNWTTMASHYDMLLEQIARR
jgi:glycosyltransferase involved in cell wall biosynthesis